MSVTCIEVVVTIFTHTLSEVSTLKAFLCQGRRRENSRDSAILRFASVDPRVTPFNMMRLTDRTDINIRAAIMFS